MAVCEETKKPFGITVDYVGSRRYKFVWAFKIDKEKLIVKDMKARP